MSMYLDTPKYYMPYDSGEDTGTDIGTDDDYDDDYDDSQLPDYEDPRIRREEDPRYAILRTAGPNFNTSQQQLKYMEHAPGSVYDNSTNITSLKDLVYLNPPKTTQTSLFSIKSSNRDKTVYNSPFFFSIKTPRVYKNVTKFQLVQLSFPNNVNSIVNDGLFLSSFVIALLEGGIPSSCISTCINVIECSSASATLALAEQGRVNANGQQTIVTAKVRTGIYSPSQLVTELNTQLNNTPPFNIISYDDFRNTFKNTRDISCLFNEPGDNFHTYSSSQYHGTHTKETIMNTYYSQKHLDSHADINDTICCNAYYYPVLKEVLATGRALPFINTGPFTYEQVVDMVLHKFEGLDSPNYSTIINLNKGALDNYRRHHTFEFRPINKYHWSFDESLNKYTCIHNSLHPSLIKDIHGSHDKFLHDELTINNLNFNKFRTLKTNHVSNTAIFNDLESNLSTQLSNYGHGVNYCFTGGVNHITSSNTLHAINDLHSDVLFTTLPLFTTSNVFGRQYGNSSGAKLNFTNFIDYHSTISSYYNIIQSTNCAISCIQGVAYDRHHQYVANKYTGILPDHMIQNKSYNNTNALPVAIVTGNYSYTPGTPVFANIPGEIDCLSICCQALDRIIARWYSCLPVNTVISGLPYMLGLAETGGTNFSILSTVNLFSSATGNFDYLMQINSQQSFNNMDIAMNEKYNVSNETTGQVKLMAAKILSAGLGAGEVTQTIIQNPIIFDNTLGKLDKLEFKIYADDAALTPLWLWLPLPFDYNEWNATFQIDEEIGFADRNTGWGQRPTIPMPNNPDAMPFLALTSTNNPNNK